MTAAAPAVHAQAVAMAGSYQNFDVLNNTGGPTYGFDMEVWGVSKSPLTRIFPSNFNAGVIRYGFGSATDFPGGTVVRWAARYDAATGTYSTPAPIPQYGEAQWVKVYKAGHPGRPPLRVLQVRGRLRPGHARGAVRGPHLHGAQPRRAR